MKTKLVALIVGISAMMGQTATIAEERPMGFFVTSQGMGKGA